MKIKNKTIKFISALLIVSILAPAFLFSKPKQAGALSGEMDDGVSTAVGATVCALFGAGAAATGAGGGFLVNKLDVTSVPVNDSVARGLLSVTTATTSDNTCIHSWEDVFEYVIREIIKLVAKRMLAQMTQATINWINSDFHGSPLFIDNPQSFFGDIAKHGLQTMVDTFGYDQLRFPFGKDFALNAIDSYKRQLEENAEYTLSKVIKDQRTLELYRNDFDYGGWDGFLTNTQYPQNNYVGFRMIANNELARRIQGAADAPAEKVQKLLQQGMGFLSPQTCPSNPDYNNLINEFHKPTFHFDEPFNPPPMADENNPTEAEEEAFWKYMSDYENRKREAQAEWNKKNTCPGGLVNTTPGSVAANQVMMALGSPLRSVELDMALGNSLSAIFDALINHFFEKGLNTLADFIDPPPEDNWSYDGNYLDDGYSDDPKKLKIGDELGGVNVSVKVDETTSERISGGNKDYSIKKLNEEDTVIVSDEINKTDDTIAIVKINFSGNVAKLEITGVKEGSYSFTVEDSSGDLENPNQSVAVSLIVGNAEDPGLLVDNSNPANIFFNDNTDTVIVATISGGKMPYSVKKISEKGIVSVNVVDTSLIIMSIKNGATSVIIKDSSKPDAKTVTVNIDSKIGPLAITPSNIEVGIGEIAKAEISNGISPFTITTQPNAGIATADLPDSTLTITGKAAGTSFAEIKDSSSPAKTARIDIEVNADAIIAANIKDARKLETYFQLEYITTGSYSNLISNTWIPYSSTCDTIPISGRYVPEYRGICNSIMNRLGSESTIHNWLVGDGSNPPQEEIGQKFSIMVKVSPAVSTNGEWFCLGSSGRTYQGPYDATAPGCYYDP